MQRGQYSQRCYLITKLIYFWALEGLFIQVGGLQTKQETAQTTGGCMYHDVLARVCGCVQQEWVT